MKIKLRLWFREYYRNWLIVSLVAIVLTVSGQLYWGHKEVWEILFPIIGGAIAMGLILGGLNHLIVSIYRFLTRKK